MTIQDELRGNNCTFPSKTIDINNRAADAIDALQGIRENNVTLMEEVSHLNDQLENILRMCPAGCEIHTALKEYLGIEEE